MDNFLDGACNARPPRVAVLLAVFNGVPWLSEQLNSILNQVNIDLTIFVSVDSSIDGSEATIDAWAAKDSRIRVLPHGCRFGGASKNFFRLIREVDLSSFDFVSLADQDDIWDSIKLNSAINLMVASKADAYSSNALAFWGNGQTFFVNKSQPQVKWDYLFEAAGPGCTYVLTSKLATAIQGLLISKLALSLKIGLHDWFIYAYARSNNFHWIIDKQSWIRYRQHASNQVGVNLGWTAFIRRVKKVSSGWAFSQTILLAEMLDKLNQPFVRLWASGSRLGLLYLAGRSWQCRRRKRDKILFFFSCLYMAIFGEKKS